MKCSVLLIVVLYYCVLVLVQNGVIITVAFVCSNGRRRNRNRRTHQSLLLLSGSASSRITTSDGTNDKDDDNDDDDDDDDGDNNSKKEITAAQASPVSSARSSVSLQEQAAQLRQEVQDYEDLKVEQEQHVQHEKETILALQQEFRQHYSVTIPILKGDGTEVLERCDFPSIYQNCTFENYYLQQPPPSDTNDDDDFDTASSSASLSSRILAVQAPLPLGIILGQEDSNTNTNTPNNTHATNNSMTMMRIKPTLKVITTVDDIQVGGNGDVVGHVQVGDVVRACTACQMTMATPTWQLLVGGIGQPKTTRRMYSCDNQPLEDIMAAIGSNTMDPQQRPVWLVLERRE